MHAYTRLICFFLLVVAGVVPSSYGQISFEQSSIDATVTADDEEVSATIRLTNNYDHDVQVRWVREVVDLPSDWQTAVCDIIQCYLPTKDSADFTLAAGASANMIVYIYRALDASLDDALVNVTVYEVDNTRERVTASYNFMQTSSTRRLPQNGYSVYPNPGYSSFSVLSPVPVHTIRLTNLLGKVVRTYPGWEGEFALDGLPDGIYLVTLYDSSGRVLRTVRYSKRRALP